MKKQRFGVFAVMAAALVITALVVGCMDVIDPSGLLINGGAGTGSGGADNGGGVSGAGTGSGGVDNGSGVSGGTDGSIMSGTGGGIIGGAGSGEVAGVVSGEVVSEADKIILRLNFNASNARTIMPTVLTDIDYENFLVTLTKTAGPGTDITNEVYDSTDVDAGIVLAAGTTYTLKVAATAASTAVSPINEGDIVAVGEYKDTNGLLIEIDADDLSGSSIEVFLHLVDDNIAATGTFAYIFDLTGKFDVETPSTDTATISLRGLSTSAQTQNSGTIPPIIITDNNVSGTLSLVVGYYEVILRIVKDGGDHFDVVFADTLQIYQGQISTWDITTIPVPVSKLFTITYDINTGNIATLPIPETGIAHRGTIISAPTPPAHTNGNFKFDGWYTAANPVRLPAGSHTLGFQWAFGGAGTGTRVFGNQTIYAAWRNETPPSLTIDFNEDYYITPAEAMDDLGEMITVTLNDVQNPSITTLPRSITIEDGNLYLVVNSFEFYIDSNSGSSDVTSRFNVAASSDDILISFDAIHNDLLDLYSTSVPFKLRVIAKDIEDNKYWGGYITFTLQPNP